MKKKDLPKIYRRQWLNEDSKGTAYVVVEAAVGERWNYKESQVVRADIEFKDCFKQISLEFSYHSEKQYEKRLKKLDSLIAALQELKDFAVANPYKDGVKLTKAEIKAKNNDDYDEDDLDDDLSDLLNGSIKE